MEELRKLKAILSQKRPSKWDELPDLGLYMDQVMSYMPRQTITVTREDSLTPAMVNNYIKDGLLPRAEGKKYGRSHLAHLTAICALKQVLSVREIKILLEGVSKGREGLSMYDTIWDEMDTALTGTAESLDEQIPQEQLAELALSLALRSYADKLACQRILEVLSPAPVDKKKKTKTDAP